MVEKEAKSQEQIIEQLLEQEMRDSYLTYAMSVIMARALPDVRDGLKPSQRRILVAMRDLNLGPRSKTTKCAGIVGETMKKYHPHGDSAIYPTLVRMAQPFNMRYVLIDGQGNFGSIDGDPAAAMRYTEARLSAVAMEMMEDIQYQTVDFQPNYDETLQEPVVLPAKFPNLLVNGSTGIAVGMATNILPHNLNEICDGLIALINNPDITVEELAKIIKGPDFPTGGIICGRKSIIEGYKTGRSNITVRAKLHKEQVRGRTLIVVDEIPYQILKTTIVEKIAEGVKKKHITDVADVRDESDRKGLRIVIELKKDANPDLVINQLYKYTPLQSSISMINIALVNRQPRTLNLKQMMELYLAHRRDVITRKTEFLLRKARQRAHIVEGLLLAVADIDEIIDLIKASADPAEAKENLMKKPLRLTEVATLAKLLPDQFIRRTTSADQFLTDAQAEAILAMQLQRLTGLELEKLANEYNKLMEQIDSYQAILNDPALVDDIIREDLYELKEKYGDNRRTEISEREAKTYKIEELIAEEDVAVTISHEGYIKRTLLQTYKVQARGGKGIKGSDSKEGDWLEHLFIANTHDYMLFFTNRGKVYWLRVYDIPELPRTSRGRAIVNLIKLSKEETIRSVVNVRTFDEDKYICMATRKGLVKKTSLAAFSHPKSTGIIAIRIDPNDELIDAVITSGKDDLILGTKNGMAIRFPEEDIRPMGRVAQGVRGIKLQKDDELIDIAVVSPNSTILTVCENGYGKRTNIDEYRRQKRGGVGLINIKTTERNGKVVALKCVTDEDELMLITAKGIIIRLAVKDIRIIGRNTQGVRLIKCDKDDKLVAVARVVKDEEQ